MKNIFCLGSEYNEKITGFNVCFNNDVLLWLYVA